MKLFEELKLRGLVKDMAGENLEEVINGKPFTFYWGTDPTADSLHLGHYSSLITAKRLALGGHNPILLCGGATGLIGDPRPTAEREIISKEKLNSNLEALKKQVTNIVGGNVEVVNNYDWFKGYEFTDVLRDVGKYININYMLDKDIIKRRLDSGITFAEFAYTLIQGYDFVHLFKEKNCIMQVAGSDQWGNITTGLELIRKKLGKEAFAFTMPLVLDDKGNKFGKSEGNALWLDEEKTSSYELYQYFINTADEVVIDYLKIFTFLTLDEISEIEKIHLEKPELREAQKVLAREIITALHGEDSYNKALLITESLFSGNISNLNSKEIETVFKGLDVYEIDCDVNIIELLVNSSICSSKREAREFVKANSISINGNKIATEEFVVTKDVAIEQRYIVIRRGKKKYFVVSYI